MVPCQLSFNGYNCTFTCFICCLIFCAVKYILCYCQCEIYPITCNLLCLPLYDGGLVCLCA